MIRLSFYCAMGVSGIARSHGQAALQLRFSAAPRGQIAEGFSGLGSARQRQRSARRTAKPLRPKISAWEHCSPLTSNFQ